LPQKELNILLADNYVEQADREHYLDLLSLVPPSVAMPLQITCAIFLT